MDLEKEQDKLREERNKLQDKINLIQKEIDEIEIKKYKVENFLNKYIRIVYDNTITIMYVKKVERLFFGPKFIGHKFIHYLCSSEYNSLYICKNGSFSSIRWADVSKLITIITKEEAVKYVQEVINDVNYFK